LYRSVVIYLEGRVRIRLATVVAMMGLMRDIHFLRMLTDAARARGPWSEAAVQDEGRPL
jgi:hypothetical protein